MNLRLTSFSYLCRGLIVLGILFTYLPLLSYDWLQIEDGSYYLRNPLLGEAPIFKRIIGSWSQAPEANWMPLTWMLAIGIKAVFGLSATAFHLCSIILHTFNALLVFRVAEKFKLTVIQAFFVGSLFALHPLQVESLAWASSLKGVLGASLALIALDVFLNKNLRFKHLWLGVLFSLSLLSKQTLLALPIVTVLLASTKPFDPLEILRQTKNQWPLFLIALIGGLAAMYANSDNAYVFTLDHFWQYPFKGFAALGHYTKTVFYPFGLHPEYSFEQPAWGLTILGVIGSLLAGYFFFRNSKNSRHLIFFIILLLPILGWWASPLELAADRLIYFPLVFLLIAVSGLFTYVKNTQISIVIILLVSITAAGISRAQLSIWKSDQALCKHTLKHTPDHFLTKLNLGLIHARAGEFQKAEKQLRENVREHPDRIESIRSLSQVLLASQQKDAAIDAVVKAMEANPSHKAYRELLAKTYRDAGYPMKAQQLLEGK